jgi:hypothetical protein
VGPEGEQGEEGIVGPQGVQGIQGIQGLKGDQGEQGVQGIQGIAGPVSAGELGIGEPTMQTIIAPGGSLGTADLITATSTSGTSLVSTAVTFEVVGTTTSSETEVSCEFMGVGVTSSNPVLRLYSRPDGMAQMVIFASITQGTTATLVCSASHDHSGVDPLTVGVRWDGSIGQRANTSNSTPQNSFAPAPPT